MSAEFIPDDTVRAFAERFLDKVGREPTFIQAANYSATTTYLSAVKAAGSTDPDKVMDELRKTKINDMFTKDGTIRADGLNGAGRRDAASPPLA